MTDTKDLIKRLREHAYTLDMRPEDCDEWKAADALETLLDALSTSYRQGLEDAAKVAEGFTDYTWRGNEGENSPSGMFARGNKHASGEIAAAIRALKVVGNDKPAFDAWWEHD